MDDPITVLDGVGPATAEAFESEFGIRTINDLLHHWPRKHRDLGDLAELHESALGEQVTLVGEITGWSTRTVNRGRRLHIAEGVVRTQRGDGFRVTFFNQRWIPQRHREGTFAAFSGKLDDFNGKLQLANPEITTLDDPEDLNRFLAERIQPVYPATEGVAQYLVARTIRRALDQLPHLEEWVDEVTLARTGLLSFDEAVREIHAPNDEEKLAAAIRRLKFDELYTLQLGLRWRRAKLEADRVGIDNAPVEGGLADQYVQGLPFEPTGAQWTALSEIREDLAGHTPMHRLLQGDVGSGKTLVAVWTMLCAVDNGRQSAMMVPTEVLAEQHFRTLLDHLAPLGVNMLDGPRVELLTGSTTATEQRRILSGLLTGDVDMVVGTHALLEPGVRFADLGVVVIDEQHRFGVDQRVSLRDKRADQPGEPSIVDVLVMTATPIPRSLALTVYGDLEVTTLDELPPGRRPIVTQLITPKQAHRRENLEGFVVERAREGEQTYWVCPLVEPSDKIDGKAATVAFEELRDGPFKDLRVGLVHGQLPSSEKDAAMRAFRDGEVDVLVATTVIEVGVDVPTATVMVIEDAERFGISQLHQLRGRVGRGGDQSYCVLFAGWRGELTDEAVERLRAVASTSDGFELAEADLHLRGSGTLFGTRQAGTQDLRLATVTDLELIAASRLAAALTIDKDPDLEDHALLADQVRRRHRGFEEFAALDTG